MELDADVRVFLFGPFRAEQGGEPLTAFKSNKVRALLVYLATERQQAHHRDVLAGLLWPDSSTTSALALLRDALSNLRLLLGDRDTDTPCVEVTQDTLRFCLHDDVWLDVAAFDTLTRTAPEVNALERAVALYRGDFLEGFSLRNNLEFDTWLLLQREAYRRAQQQALYQLTTHYLQAGNYAAAQATARRQLQIDAYTEEAHRQLLRALALNGQRNQALAQYADYCALLEAELGVDPDIRTQALYRRIRDHQLAPEPASHQLHTGNIPATGAYTSSQFVGRETELARLAQGLRQAQRGISGILLITGSDGSGKTSLIETFVRRHVVDGIDTVAAWGTCNAQIGSGDPYLPFREMLRMLTGDFDVSTLNRCLTPALTQRLENLVPHVVSVIRELGPDLGGTLLPAAERFAPAQPLRSRPPRQLAALCDQVTRVLGAVARQATLVLVLDDLHWADESTLNLLAHLNRRLHDHRILLIAAYRPAEAPPALNTLVRELQRHWGDIDLTLDGSTGRAFIDALLDSRPNALGSAFRESLYRQTRGHALFTVALLQQLQRDGTLTCDTKGKWIVKSDLDWHYLPPQVEAVIGTQIARLPADLRALLTVASVEGERFTAEVVARVLGIPNDTVQQALRGSLQTHQLIEAQGLERVGDRRVARYRFRHALFQQYLYDQPDVVARAQYHEAIGKALEILYAGQPEAAVRLAYHFEAAGMLEEAVTYLTQAGAYAYQLSAPTEALALYQRGLTLLEELPASPSRARLELAVQMNLEGPLLVTQGWAAPERALALERAYTLAQQVEDIPRLLTTLYALSDLRTAQGKNRQALAFAEQLLALAQRAADRGYETLGYRMTGVTHFFLGHYREARTQLEAGLTCYSAILQEEADPGTEADIERAVFLWAWLPHVLLGLGYPKQAAASSREALKCVHPDGAAHAQAIMLTIAAVSFHAMARQRQAALRYAEELLALAMKYEMVGFKGWAIFFRGWGRMEMGKNQSGLEEMIRGWEHLQSTNTQGSLPQLSILLAEAYMRSGNTQQSSDILTLAHDLAIRTETSSHLAEIYRLQGELCQTTDPVQAETLFRQAIDVAQAQETKLWELRATVNLARLWRDEGRAQEAHARLTDIYNWFTEGFDMPDLIEARTLLEQLAGLPGKNPH